MLLRTFLSVGLLAVLLGTAACSSSSSSSSSTSSSASSSSAAEAAATPAKVESSLGGLPPEVAVKVEELPPGQEVERVVLVDPLGNEVQATELSTPPPPGRRARAGVSSGGVGFGIGGGSGGFRIGPSISLGVPLGRSGSSGGRSGTATAKIPVPDPDTYFRESDEWKVVVYTRDKDGNPYSYEMPAPEFPGDRKVETIAPGGGGASGF